MIFALGIRRIKEEFTSDGNKTFAAPVYNYFMDEANKIAKSELIHPASFYLMREVRLKRGRKNVK